MVFSRRLHGYRLFPWRVKYVYVENSFSSRVFLLKKESQNSWIFFFLSFSLASICIVFNYADDNVFRANKFPLAREPRMTLSLRWMCMQRTTFHPVFFPSRLFFFFFLRVPASIELEKSSGAQRRRKNLVACRVDLSTLFSWDENEDESIRELENIRFVEWIFNFRHPISSSPGNVFRSFKDCAYEEEHRGRVETVPCQHRCRKTSSLPFDSYFEWHPLETLERVTSVTCGGITPAYFSCDYVSCESSKQSACKVSSRTMKSLM